MNVEGMEYYGSRSSSQPATCIHPSKSTIPRRVATWLNGEHVKKEMREERTRKKKMRRSRSVRAIGSREIEARPL